MRKEEKRMKFEEFVEEIIENMQKRVPENYLVQVQNICKNNDLKLTGLTIGDQNLNIYPTIYLEEFYKKYEEGVSFETITDIIWNTYCHNSHNCNCDTSRFIEWRNVKDIICPKIINYGANRELLNSVPYRKVCDLAVVYYAVVDICENGVASILLRNEHLKLWGKTEADLYELALENYRRIFSITSRNLDDIILELMNCKEDISFDENTIVPMIVVTNNKKLNGAAAILFPDELQKIADKMGADLYILPSSVHEIILLSTDNTMTVDELKETVCFVNSNELRQEEVLSDNVYLFNRHNPSIEIVS